jgi:hypothetical protein
MSDKEEKLKVEIERQQEIERKIDESISYEERHESFRDITKMQAPDQWPDPPETNEESSDGE